MTIWQTTNMRNMHVSFATYSLLSISLLVCASLIMAAPQRLVPLTIILTPSSLFLARVFREWTYRDDAANSDSVLYMFGLGFVPGMLLSIFIECLLSVLIAMLFVNDYFEEILRLMLEQSTPSDPAAKTALIWQRVLTSVGILRVVAMAVLLCFVVAGLVEETVKLALVAPLPCSPVNTMPDLGRSHKVLAGVAAFSIGFAVSESIAYVCLGSSDLLKMSIDALFRTVIACPLHVILACLTATRYVHAKSLRPSSYFWALLPSILIHGAYDSGAVLIAVSQMQYTENLSDIVVFILNVIWGFGVVSFSFALLRATWKRHELYVRYHPLGILGSRNGVLQLAPGVRLPLKPMSPGTHKSAGSFSGLLKAATTADQRPSVERDISGDDVERQKISAAGNDDADAASPATPDVANNGRFAHDYDVYSDEDDEDELAQERLLNSQTQSQGGMFAV